MSCESDSLCNDISLLMLFTDSNIYLCIHPFLSRSLPTPSFNAFAASLSPPDAIWITGVSDPRGGGVNRVANRFLT